MKEGGWQADQRAERADHRQREGSISFCPAKMSSMKRSCHSFIQQTCAEHVLSACHYTRDRVIRLNKWMALFSRISGFRGGNTNIHNIMMK